MPVSRLREHLAGPDMDSFWQDLTASYLLLTILVTAHCANQVLDVM